MRAIEFRISFLCLAAAALLAGCDGSSTPSDTLDFCSQDEDCPFGQFCDDGVCSAGLGPCGEFDECPPGQICRHGACVADGDADGGVDGGDDDGGVDSGDDVAGGPDIAIVSPPPSGAPPSYQLNFGNVAVGVAAEQQVVVENTGDAELRILQLNLGLGEGNEDFSVPAELLDALPLVLAPGEQTELDVVYLASDGTTDHGVLDIISNDPDEPSVRIELLSEFKGEADVALSPEQLAFGDVPLGQTSDPLLLTIANQGTGNAVLTVEDVRFAVAQNPDFSLELTDVDGQPVALPALLNNGDALDARVRYHPQAAEADSDELVVASDDPLQPSATVPLSGRGVIGAVEIAPSPIDLGQVRVGEIGEQVVTISNAGGAPLSLTGVALADAGPDWTLGSEDLDLAGLADNPHPLAPGAAVEVLLAYAPATAGDASGQLLVEHTGPSSPTQAAISASGYVPASLELEPDPPRLDFGDVQIDVASGQSDQRTLSLTIHNTGGEPLRIEAIGLAAGTSPEFSWTPASLAPIAVGEQAVLDVTFSPTGTGTKTGLLLLDSNDPDVELDGQVGRVGVELEARGTDPLLFVSPAAGHDFGVTSIGQHKTLDVTVRNASSFPLLLENVRLTAGSAAAYGLSDLPGLPLTIPDSNTEIHFTVDYLPTNQGDHSGAVEIVSSDLGNPLVTLALEGQCQGCPAGTADCDPDVPGCETDILNDDGNCGGCGNTCTNPHGSTGCSGGECQPDCDPLWGDCDGDPNDGCETPLDTLSDCGGCDSPCALPHADATCAGGSCAVAACDDGYGDCTAEAGCETHTYSDPANCGACGNTCSNAHGSTDCIAGGCSPVCDPLWGDCDDDPDDGCETPLDTLSDCGACGQGCALAHASETCASGSCAISACSDGWCDMNALPGDGCEFDLDTDPACGNFFDIGIISGDDSNDEVSETGVGEQWLRLRVTENNNGIVYLSAIIWLDVPNGTDYDLHVYCDNCSDSAGSSYAGGSTNERVDTRWSDTWGSDDSRYLYIHVIFYSGNNCSPWTLTAGGNYEVATETCD